jgi:hypothetical protein
MVKSGMMRVWKLSGSTPQMAPFQPSGDSSANQDPKWAKYRLGTCHWPVQTRHDPPTAPEVRPNCTIDARLAGMLSFQDFFGWNESPTGMRKT